MTDPAIADNEGLWGGRLFVFRELASTNQWALDNIDQCRHGDVVLAVSQTAGRGRFQREWHVPENTSLTISLILEMGTSDGGHSRSLIGLASALAVRSTVESHGVDDACVKWPNDVLVAGRKIAGILAEACLPSDRIVVGVGLNVNICEEYFSGMQLLQPATSMAIETGQPLDIDEVRCKLLTELAHQLGLVNAGKSDDLFQEWARFDALVRADITIRTLSCEIVGKYAGMTDDGRLRLATRSGGERVFSSGDVSVRCSRFSPTPS